MEHVIRFFDFQEEAPFYRCCSPVLPFAPRLHVDLKAKVDLRRRNAALDSPISCTALAQKHLHVMGGDTELSEISDQSLITRALGPRLAGEQHRLWR
jgi:hypothetical protein